MAWTKALVIGSTALVDRTLAFLVVPDEVQGALQNLQAAHDDVQIHPVDGFRFQNHMLVQHFRNGLW
jgi:hypothetical protein